MEVKLLDCQTRNIVGGKKMYSKTPLRHSEKFSFFSDSTDLSHRNYYKWETLFKLTRHLTEKTKKLSTASLSVSLQQWVNCCHPLAWWQHATLKYN